MLDPHPLPGLRLGPLTIHPPVGLSPMAGLTDMAMRGLARAFHCGFTFTEITNAGGLLHGSQPTFHLLESDGEDRPLGAHIYGTEPGPMADACALIQRMNRFDFIDLNCGCPVRKIVAKGAGAALIRDPDRLAAIVRAMRSATDLPVTVKTRIGFDEDCINIVELAQAVEAAGAAAIAVHARLAARKHAGPADWAMLAAAKSACRIPVIGNGGIDTAKDVWDMIRQTGVDGVLIGRAAIGNPWLFEEIHSLANGRHYRAPGIDERRAVIARHFDRLLDLHARDRRNRRQRSRPLEETTALHMRPHLVKYLRGGPGWPAVRRGLNDLSSRSDVMRAVDIALDTGVPGSDRANASPWSPPSSRRP